MQRLEFARFNNLMAVYHFLTKRFLAKAVSKVKQAHTCAPHPPTSMSPNTFRPPTLTFNPSIFPSRPSFISLCNSGSRRSFAFVAGEGKGRSGLHLSFASPYHFSNLAPPPFLPQHPLICLPHTAMGLEWSEERQRAELTHDTELLTL